MFCALNGATETPRRRSHAQIAVVIQLLPAFDEVPPMKIGRAGMRSRSLWRVPCYCPTLTPPTRGATEVAPAAVVVGVVEQVVELEVGANGTSPGPTQSR